LTFIRQVWSTPPLAAYPETLAASPSDRTRDAILEAARRRFLRFGPRKTTIDEVAREAGLSARG
jgi:AcrR family transcriptional regulator